jgi:LysM repeat protein
MRRQQILALSIGINILLLLAFVWTRKGFHSAPQTASSTPSGSNTVRTQVVVRKQFFSWQELESNDYQQYVKNLRDIGCPEPTIRDIIIADVNQLYVNRFMTEVTDPDQEWWRSTPSTNLLADSAAKKLALNQERKSLLETLLGTNWDIASIPLETVVPLNGKVLGDLPLDTKQAVERIVSRQAQQWEAYVSMQTSMGNPVDDAEYARLEQKTRVELSHLLTPDQLEEYMLRHSGTASGLRSQLRSVDLTPDEFRRLFRIADPLGQELNMPETEGTDHEKLVTDVEQQMQAAMKSVLGPERYQKYRVDTDPVYQAAWDEAVAAGAPPGMVDSLYQLKTVAADQRNKILADASLSDDQKAAQLKALDQQVQSADNQLLGIASGPPLPPLPPEAPTPPARVHGYNPGETIDQIAAQYGVSANAILNANPNVNFNQLSPGAPIRIPRAQ